MASSAARRLLSVVALAIAVADVPPTEFRIFAAGENDSYQGKCLFDARAAELVMADYQRHGAELMIDYAHGSLSAFAVDPALAGKAAGWFNLEVRNGELWAINIRWTQPANDALARSEWRYMSPAFLVDKDGRVTSLINVALTNIPATHDLEPLVAASRRDQLDPYQKEGVMTAEQFGALAEALGLGADANVEDVLATVAAMVKKIQDAANGTSEAPADAPAEDSPGMLAATQLLAAARTLARLSGKVGIAEAVSEVEAWRESHLELEEGRKKLAQEQATLEGSERRRLVAELVKCGAETPAFAWALDAAGVPDGKTPAPEYAAMSLERLRAKVAARATVPPKKPRPAGSDADTELSERELEKCKKQKIDPKKYAANKRAMTGEV